MHVEAEGDTGRAIGQLLAQDRVVEIRPSRAADRLREAHAEVPELAELGEELHGEALLPIALRGKRRDLPGHELP